MWSTKTFFSKVDLTLKEWGAPVLFSCNPDARWLSSGFVTLQPCSSVFVLSSVVLLAAPWFLLWLVEMGCSLSSMLCSLATEDSVSLMKLAWSLEECCCREKNDYKSFQSKSLLGNQVLPWDGLKLLVWTNIKLLTVGFVAIIGENKLEH